MYIETRMGCSLIGLSAVLRLNADPSLVITTNPASQQLLVEPSLTSHTVDEPKGELNRAVHSFWFGESDVPRQALNSSSSVHIAPAEMAPLI
jgi:hypothetical protein